MLICPKCHIEYKEGIKFCGECGATLISKEKGSPSPEKKEVEISGKSLVCPNCHLAYEFGEVCIQCGSPLGSKAQVSVPLPPSIEDRKEPTPSSLIFSEETSERPRRLICPNCKLIYERSTLCIRCGSSLLEEIPPEEKGAGETEPQEEIKQEKAETIPFETKKDAFPLKDEPQRKEKRQTPGVDLKKKSSSVRASTEREKETLSLLDGEDLLGIEPSEKKREKKTIIQIFQGFKFPNKGVKKIRGLSFQMVSIAILIVAVGYLVWSIYSLISPKQPKRDIPTPKDHLSLIPPKSPDSKPFGSTPEPKESDDKQQVGSTPVSKEVSTTPHPTSLSPSSQIPYSEMRVIEDIKQILETIRRANLEKDIDLFMSCYSFDFKDLESKRKSTLENWKSFSYLDLSYDLKRHSISGDKASIRVEWTIRFSPKSDGQPRESKTILDVVLKKEYGTWKIKEILPIS